ncbi:hypothetical protein LZQ00_06470 [Sphingobacterium sp. SRCM116780]|uniref:hypothetical protein n=1 Tax=Sphingobacterium sp. SRCM116780 TaxID=2907623 RepID=UPI001F2377FD|nr:hypothetical protein [Sphingobacterium sp. SRCM116780]UIR57458.1 hypothetical protein LZQ00_06470 [Sphingobacterium sp. SRCM116780]
MAVTVVDLKKRVKEDGTDFFLLVLQGQPEIVKSQSGKSYMNARRTSVSTTFNEQTCKDLIGTKFTGTIKKVECGVYEYIVPESGEVIKLDFRYEYYEDSTMEEAVFETV